MHWKNEFMILYIKIDNFSLQVSKQLVRLLSSTAKSDHLDLRDWSCHIQAEAESFGRYASQKVMIRDCMPSVNEDKS